MNLFARFKDASDCWNIKGDFGDFSATIRQRDFEISAENNDIYVESQIIRYNNGVRIRTGKIRNISNREVNVNVLSSKFTLDGGEYEVYTQYNGWQNESKGMWQVLNTIIGAESKSVRNASGAAPFMVLWNVQSNRGTAFHLAAYSTWEMKAGRVYEGGEVSYIEVLLGVQSESLNLKLAPGEEVELPEIIYYDVFNRTDLDCWKLHQYLNEKYPRKAMPVIYNTWLYKFDSFTYDDLRKQIEKAGELGCEYFVVDAGWFGKDSDWFASRGDWIENKEIGFCGHMAEFAELVRECGMKFGFWMEPECASLKADVVKVYPEYFLKGKNSYFLDFSNSNAVEHIFDITCRLIDKYKAEFLKFDFNADLTYDKTQSAFIRYFIGYQKYISRLKEKYPHMYIENCASGGMRMSIRDGKVFDSFWLSDNQSPYYGLRIFKDTLLRMPPQWIECWASIRSLVDFEPHYGCEGNEFKEKIVSTNDASWTDIVSVKQSYLNGFLTGNPIGISCDLTLLSPTAFGEFKEFINKFKAIRTFWQKCVCHILTDTDSILVLEFRDEEFSRIELVVFVKKTIQDNVCVYPVVKHEVVYAVEGQGVKMGKELYESGIDFPVNGRFSAQCLSLEQK